MSNRPAEAAGLIRCALRRCVSSSSISSPEPTGIGTTRTRSPLLRVRPEALKALVTSSIHFCFSEPYVNSSSTSDLPEPLGPETSVFGSDRSVVFASVAAVATGFLDASVPAASVSGPGEGSAAVTGLFTTCPLIPADDAGEGLVSILDGPAVAPGRLFDGTGGTGGGVWSPRDASPRQATRTQILCS